MPNKNSSELKVRIGPKIFELIDRKLNIFKNIFQLTTVQRMTFSPLASKLFPFFHPGRHLHVHFLFDPVLLFFSLHSSLSRSEKIDLFVPSGMIL